MPTSMIIVDDFMEDPYSLRNAGLGLDYVEGMGPFPGRNSATRITVDGLDQEVSRILGEPVRGQPAPQANGKFRISLAKDKGKAKVHVDPAHWSGILYLSRPEDCRGGIEFLRT